MGDPLGFKIASEKFKICPWWILICISRNPAFFRRVTQKPAQEEKRPAVRCFFSSSEGLSTSLYLLPYNRAKRESSTVAYF